MSDGSRHFIFWGLLVILLAACSPATPTPEPQNTPLPTPTLRPTPTPEPPRTLTICAGSEPVDLFVYSQPGYIKSAILSAIYDGPIDMVDYTYQPVILDKLPSLADGDAVIETVQVQEGQRIVDASGALAVLQAGVIVRPAGCRSSDCAVAYESGALAMDQMRVVFHIKPGVQWADGAPLTAEDSVFSYQVSLSEDVLYSNAGLVSGSAASFSFTSDYTALDASTVQWTGLPGFLDPNYQLNFYTPLPKHQLSAYAIPDLLAANEVLYSPLGWGPYRVTGWDQGQQLTLEPNPNFFRAWEGLPSFSQLVFRFLGQDMESNLAAFDDGQCDILLQDAMLDTPTATMLVLVNGGVARLYLDPQPVFEHLTFNLSPADPAAPAYFASLAVRQAAAMCLDRAALTDAVYAGLVPPLDMALPSDHPLLNGAPQSTTFYNPETAMQLLDGAGWTDGNGDGVREAHAVSGIPDGQPLTVQLVLPESPLRTQVSQLVASQLLACGLGVTVVQAPARDLFAQDADALLSGRHFDLAEFSSPVSVESLCTLAGSGDISGEANGWSGNNLSGYSNPQFDAICADVHASLPGTPEYTTSRQSALVIFSNGLPVLPLFLYSNFTLARPDLTGIATGFGQASELQNIESFRLEP